MIPRNDTERSLNMIEHLEDAIHNKDFALASAILSSLAKVVDRLNEDSND